MICLTIVQSGVLTSLEQDDQGIHSMSYNQHSSSAQKRYTCANEGWEEGYDLPNLRCRLWLASVTAESGSVAAFTIHSASNDMSPPSPTDLESVCQAGRCEHPKARKWVQCDYCPLWYHCLCSGQYTQVSKTKSISVFIASWLDDILATHCSRPYMTAIIAVTMLSIVLFDDPGTSCSRQCCSVSIKRFCPNLLM